VFLLSVWHRFGTGEYPTVLAPDSLCDIRSFKIDSWAGHYGFRDFALALGT
jgi:hypothetical protein